MSSLSDKIQYTKDAIDAIQAALEYHGIDMNSITLKEYSDIIEKLKTSSEKESSGLCLFYDLEYRMNPVPLKPLVYKKQLQCYNSTCNQMIDSIDILNVVSYKAITDIKINIIDNPIIYQNFEIPIEIIEKENENA